MIDVLLVNPPISLPSEPPPGLAHLTGGLRARGLSVEMLDGSIEALDGLAEETALDAPSDGRARRFARLWRALREPRTYTLADRHFGALQGAAAGLNAAAAARGPYRLSLTDYVDRRRDPYASDDLLDAARNHDDWLFSPWVERRLLPEIDRLGPRVLGIGINYRQQALPGLAMAGAVRRAYPRLPIVIGGGLVSTWLAGPGPTERLLEFADALVAGDGEEAIAALATGAPLADATGAFYRSADTDGEGQEASEALHRNPVRRYDPASLASTPAFDGLPLDRYLAPAPVLPVASSRGCYWRKCAFCPEALHTGEGFATVKAETFLGRLASLRQRYDAPWAHVVDSAVAPALLRGLADAPLPAAPLPEWYGFARFEPALQDPDICRALRERGCRALQLGLESGSQRLLDLIRKGIRLEDAARSLRTLHEAGIMTIVYVLVGMPTETLEDAAATRDFLVANSEYVDYLHASVMNLPIGSPLDHDPGRYLLPPEATESAFPGDLSLCRDLTTTGTAERRQLRRFLAKDMLRHPAIRPMVRHLPPQLGANHAILRPTTP